MNRFTASVNCLGTRTAIGDQLLGEVDPGRGRGLVEQQRGDLSPQVAGEEVIEPASEGDEAGTDDVYPVELIALPEELPSAGDTLLVALGHQGG